MNLLGLLIFAAVVTASLFCTNLYVMYFILFFGGISETGRYYVAYVYCVEFFPSKY
jgi:MFS family permease